MFVLALVPLALADIAIAAPEMCAQATPNFTFPQADATGVAVDVAPVVLFTDGNCGIGPWSLTVRDADGAVVGSVEDTPSDWILELVLDAPLAPDTTFTMTLTPTDGAGTEQIVSFTTGDALSSVHGVTPEITAVDAEWSGSSFQLIGEVTADMGAGAGADLVTAWVLTTPEGVRKAYASREARGMEAGHTFAVDAGVLPEEACVTVAAREADGTWHTGDERCAEVADVTPLLGCNSGGGAASLIAVGAAVVGLAARRRR